MSSVKIDNISVELLKGSENYQNWKCVVKNVFCIKDLSKTLDGSETDAGKKEKARAHLMLAIDQSVRSHVANIDTAKGIWDKLNAMYEDAGLSRQISLLSGVCSLNLSNCENMQQYINKMMDYFNRLEAVKFILTDTFKIGLMLKGLDDGWKPFIMGLEANSKDLKSDFVMQRLMDAWNSEESSEKKAFVSNKEKFKSVKNDKGAIKKDFSKIKCYNCEKMGHYARDCTKAKKKPSEKSDSKNVTESAIVATHKANVCTTQRNEWYIDSGATAHITPFEEILTDIEEISNMNVYTANNQAMKVSTVGVTKVKFDAKLTVKEVLHVPEATANLLSVAKITRNGNSVIFDKNGCRVLNASNTVIASCAEVNGMYKFVSTRDNCLLSVKDENQLLMWHRKLGHLNYQALLKMKNGAVDGVNFNENADVLKSCKVCCLGKQHVLPYEESTRQTTSILDLIHSDLCGPMESESFTKAKYFVTFIDDYSRLVFTYFLVNKSDAFEKFKEFKEYVENATGKKIKILRTDNGLEYCNSKFNELCKASGIKHETSCAYTPAQNGVAERCNRTLIERSKCLMFDANLPKRFWAEAVNWSTYLMNHSYSSVHEGIPHERFFNQRVKLEKLKLFGTKVMVLIPKEKRRKLDANSVEMVFTGYDMTRKAYRCVNKSTGDLMVSRNVNFLDAEVENVIVFDLEPENEKPEEVEPEKLVVNPKNQIEEPSEGGDSDESSESIKENTPRAKKDWGVPNVTTRSNKPPRMLMNFANLSILSDPQYVLKCDSNESAEDPTSFDEIQGRSDRQNWNQAMTEEYDSLMNNETWKLVDIPDGKRVIQTETFFKTKSDADGKVVRHKAKLVARGFSQRYGIDYEETYAPVIRYQNIRMLIALAVKFGLKVHQLDAVTAFLQGDINAERHISQPEGFNDGSQRVCRLKKAIYDAELRKMKLMKSKLDPCLYYEKGSKFFIAIYVDDCKSVAGYIFLLGSGAISWKSSKQSTVALSSTEAEYIALGAGVQEAIYIRQMLQELQTDESATKIFVDNTSTIALAKADGYKPRTKHIDIKRHFLREQIVEGVIVLKHVNAKLNVADMLTKGISAELIGQHTSRSGLVSI